MKSPPYCSSFWKGWSTCTTVRKSTEISRRPISCWIKMAQPNWLISEYRLRWCTPMRGTILTLEVPIGWVQKWLNTVNIIRRLIFGLLEWLLYNSLKVWSHILIWSPSWRCGQWRISPFKGLRRHRFGQLNSMISLNNVYK